MKRTLRLGNVVERREYEPYGAVLTGIKDGPGYAEHVSDAQTGLAYMQWRYYDLQLGIFDSVDPVTAYSSPVANFCRYCYANNNPYKFTDPDGRATVYRYADKIVIVKTFKNNGTQFTDDQIKSQGGSLSSQTSDGKAVEVRLVPGTDKDAIQFNSNPKLDETSPDGALR